MADETRLPRGIRNHNPGNIREFSGGGIEWEGERATDDDPAFEEFDSPEYGIRAFGKILLTYQRKYNLKTVRGMISRWAPPFENNTEAYIKQVSAHMGVGPLQEIDLSSSAFLMALMIEAMIKHENGIQPYEEETILAGVEMALA